MSDLTPLKPALDAIRAGFEPKVPAEVLQVMHRANSDLQDQADAAVAKGTKLPAFTLPDQDGNHVSSADLLAKGPLVVSFFRGHWCPYCMAELTSLNEALPDIRAAGAELVVITPQTPAKSKEMIADKGFDLTVLSDDGLAYAETLGLAFALPADLKAIYQQFGLDLPGTNGDGSWRLPIPARLIVAQDGRVVGRDVDPDYSKRPEPAETLAALKVHETA